ncbi:MAG: IPT/TIG domain-containing protein, partial [Acidimicrobiales bacterium]
VAVDSAGNAIIYNGVSWSAPASVDTSGLTSVSCSSTESCVAADTSGNALYYHAPPPPMLTSLSPSTGPISGGTTVTISGSGFSSVKDVRFGSVAATSFKIISASSLQAVTPSYSSPSTVAVTISNASATSPPEATCGDSFTYGTSPPTQSPNGYVSLSPSRIADTRPLSGKPYAGDTLGACSTLDIQASGAGNIPSSGVSAVVLNLTATDPSASGYLSVYPAGSIREVASNLNFGPGRTVANLVEVPVNPSTGQVAIYNGSNGATNVVVDAEGYVPSDSVPSGYLYNPVSPVRVCDTRPGNPSGLSGALAQCNSDTPGAGTSFVVNVGGVGSIPADATAAILNVTAVDPVSPGYLSIYPAGSAVPDTSNVNFTSGLTVANTAVVPLSTSGAIDVFTSAVTNVIVDVEGYFTAGTGSRDETLSPSRICDTRPGSGEPYAGQTLGPGSTLKLVVAGVAGVPVTATAVVLNVTVTDTTASGYLTVYPGGVPRPMASNLNWKPGATLANMVVARIGASGTVDIYNYSGSTDVVVDVEGYYG